MRGVIVGGKDFLEDECRMHQLASNGRGAKYRESIPQSCKQEPKKHPLRRDVLEEVSR